MHRWGDGLVNEYMRTIVLSHQNSAALLDTVDAVTLSPADLKVDDYKA